MREITLNGNKIAEKANNVGISLMPEFVAFGDALHKESERTNLSLNKLFPELVADGLKLGKSMTYLASQSSTVFGALGYIPHISLFRLKDFMPVYGKLPKNTSQRDRVKFWTLACNLTTEAKALGERFGVVGGNKAKDSDASEKIGEMPDDRIQKLARELVRTEKLPVFLAEVLNHFDGNALITLIQADMTARAEAEKMERDNMACAAMAFTV